MLTHLIFHNKYIPGLINRFRFTSIGYYLLIPGLLVLTVGCDSTPQENSANNSPSTKQQSKPPAVDTAIATQGSLEQDVAYIGTTFPVGEVSLRSRIEGQILDLNVDVGDPVEKGQVLVKIDDSLNQATVLEATAELEARRSEITSLEADVNQSQTQVEQAKISLQQAQSDLVRSNQLVKEGAVTQQSAEQAQNRLDNAQQALRSAQQQLANRSSLVIAAQRRIAAQEAIVAQEQQRKSFSLLTSPVTGSVLGRALEPGDLAQVGDEILQLGDFSQIQVQVQISELELSQIRLGQRAQVKLDAFPEQTFMGEVTQISLAANATARLVPIEVTIPNQDDRIGKGLLARVSFNQQQENTLVIPETAVQVSSKETKEVDNNFVDHGTIFIVEQEQEQTTVTARQVTIGGRANSQIEILSGLQPGERFVIRSSRDLKEGDQVRLSILAQ